MYSAWFPKVSIIIPIYNGANYMREAIDSALAQTYENIEIIVVNDGSTDEGETERIALEYGNKIRYFRKENGGVSSALNFGIRQMTGDYFSWLSHDDVYLPDKIRHQVDSLAALEDKNTVALCAHYFIDESSNRLSKKARKRFETGCHSWNQAVRELLTHGSFSGCALLLPKQVFTDCGVFDESLRFSQDYLMWMRIFLNRYSLVYNTHEDVCNRIHSKQLTQRGRNIFREDSLTISRVLAPRIADISDKNENYLYLYAKRNAKYGVNKVVSECRRIAKERSLFGVNHILVLRFKLFIGSFRPTLRKIYYKLIVKTE